jgi:hypothetical protein
MRYISRLIRSSCSKALDFVCHFPDDVSWFQNSLSHEPALNGHHQDGKNNHGK